MGKRWLVALGLILLALGAWLAPVGRESEPEPSRPAPVADAPAPTPVPPAPDPVPPEGPPSDLPPPPEERGPPRPPMPPQTGFTLSGYVVSAAGKRIGNARVNLEPGRNLYRAGACTRTDGAGRFRFRGLGRGPYVVAHPIPHATSVRRSVEVNGDVEDLCLRVPPGRTLVVRLVDEQGQPVEGAEIRAHQQYGSLMRKPSRANGTMTFFLTRGFRSVVARRSDRSGMPSLLSASSDRLPTEGEPLVLVLREAGTVSGRVLMPSGEPVGRLIVDSFEGPVRVGTADTDSDGRFSIRGPRGGAVDLVVSGLKAPGHRQDPIEVYATARVRGVPVGTQNVVVTLEPAARDRTLTVRVEAPDGRPLPGGRVCVWSREAFTELARGDSDDEGRVILRGLPGVPVYLRADEPEGVARPFRWLPPRMRELVPAGQTEILRFRRAVSLTGRVVDGRGENAGPCKLQAAEAGGLVVASGKTSADGRFTLDIPEDAKLPLVIRAHRDWTSEAPNLGCIRLPVLEAAEVRIRLDGSN